MNRPIMTKDIEAVIEKSSNNEKTQHHMASQIKSTKHLKKNVSILLKLLRKIDLKRTLPILFYETSITLIPKPNNEKKKINIDTKITSMK